MNRKLLPGMIMVLFAVAAFPAFAQDVYYVQSLKARIMTSPSFKAGILGEASKGSKLQSTGRTGSWVKVVIDQKEGFVSSLLLSKFPPLERQRIIKGEEVDIKQGVRRRASTYTSAAAARGLTHEDRKRLSSEEEVDYKALEKIEALQIGNDEVTRFIEGGKL